MFISSFEMHCGNAIAVGTRARVFNSPSSRPNSPNFPKICPGSSRCFIRFAIILVFRDHRPLPHRMHPTVAVRSFLICAVYSCYHVRVQIRAIRHGPKANRSIFNDGERSGAERSERGGFHVISRADLSRLRITASLHPWR